MPKRKSWTKGAQKAYDAIVDRYGTEEGEHIFYGRVTKIAGTEGSINKRASQAFKTGGTQKPDKRHGR